MPDQLNDSLTPEEIEEITGYLDRISSILVAKGKALSSEERIKLPKARKGFEKYLVMLLAIARESNVDLKMHPIDGLMTDVQLQQGLTVINQRLKGLSTLSNDTISLANSEAWQAFLDYYGVLNAMGVHDPNISGRMKPIVQFMSINQRKKGKEEDLEDVDLDLPKE